MSFKYFKYLFKILSDIAIYSIYFYFNVLNSLKEHKLSKKYFSTIQLK